MQILLACAKIMTGTAPASLPLTTTPTFLPQAEDNIRQLLRYSPEELQGMLRCNPSIASENWHRYRQFHNADSALPAIFAYDGMVFQKLSPETFSPDDLLYANDHLLIGSFLYGLLRPLDRVHPYRLEGDVVLPDNGVAMFDYWKPILTDWFISRIQADDGILVNLASNEFKDLFDWNRVEREVTVVTPQFKVDKGGKLSTVVIYTKMCRGSMARWILQHRLTHHSSLRHFTYEGYSLPSDAKDWVFVNR
ncbi:MAG: YaaA family protein [Bacteroidales bacterium]|nr:YaaA family protein [Bacteroidales bacterium]